MWIICPLCVSQLSAEDFSSLSRLLSPLETLSQQHSDVVVQELASNLRAVIATRGAYRPDDLTAAAPPSRIPEPASSQSLSEEPEDAHSGPSAPSARSTHSPKTGGRSSGTADPPPPPKPLSDWLLEACDPDVPTKAFALRVLTQMVQHRDPEAVQAQEKVLMVGPSLPGCLFV